MSAYSFGRTRSTTPPWALSALGSALDLDFRSDRYLRQSVPETLSGIVTFSRASIADWLAPSGPSLAARAAVNQPRRDGRGLLIEAPVTAEAQNALLTDAAAGTPGTLPARWSITAPAGLTRTLSQAAVGGVPVLTVTYRGVATSSEPFIWSSAGTTTAAGASAASAGQGWVGTLMIGVQDESMPLTALTLQAQGQDAAGAQSELVQASIHSTRHVFGRRMVAGTLAAPATASLRLRCASNIIAAGTTVQVSFQFGLPMLHQGTQPTSPVLTGATAATRAGESCTIALSTLMTAQAPRTLIVIARAPAAPAVQVLARMDPASGNGWRLLMLADGTLAAGLASGSVNLGSLLAGQRFALAAAMDGTGTSASLNGAVPLGNATPAGDGEVLRIGSTDGASAWNGFVERVILFPRRLSAAELQVASQLVNWGG